MTVSETKLLPCPFCGSEDIHLHRPQQALGSWVSCHSCGLESPTETGVTEDEAAKYWNTRALTAALSDQAPKEPTGGMLAAGRDAIQPHLPGGRVAQPLTDQWQIAREVYAAMIAAAPPPSSPAGEGK